MTKSMIWFTLVILTCTSCANMKNKEVSSQNNPSAETDSPIVTSPEVHRIWVPDKIEGSKYIKGHYMYVIERGSVWTMP